MTEEEAYAAWLAARFAANGGEPICPHCGCMACYKYKTRRVFKCKDCTAQFSATSGTDFADRKLSFLKILESCARFAIAPKGLSLISMSLELDVNYRTAFLTAKKFRQAMMAEMTDVQFTGAVEIDGCEIGGFIRPKNVKKKTTDYRKWPHRSNKGQYVVVLRQRGGRGGKVVTTVVKREGDAKPFIQAHTDRNAIIYADSAQHWNSLGLRNETKTINHKEAYYTPEADTNTAESFFAMLRRAEHGHYHHISGGNLPLYAAEQAWRQQNNRTDTKKRFHGLLELSAKLRDRHDVRSHGEQQWQ